MESVQSKFGIINILAFYHCIVVLFFVFFILWMKTLIFKRQKKCWLQSMPQQCIFPQLCSLVMYTQQDWEWKATRSTDKQQPLDDPVSSPMVDLHVSCSPIRRMQAKKYGTNREHSAKPGKVGTFDKCALKQTTNHVLILFYHFVIFNIRHNGGFSIIYRHQVHLLFPFVGIHCGWILWCDLMINPKEAVAFTDFLRIRCSTKEKGHPPSKNSNLFFL